MNQSLWGFKGLKEIANIHPVFVHFPIALFPLVLLLYAIGILGKMPGYLSAGRVSLYLAALSGVLTVLTGLQARRTIKFNMTLGQMVKTHQGIGLSIFFLAVVATVWSFFQENNLPRAGIPFLVVLVAINYLALQNADIGSLMVYTQGAGVKPAGGVVPEPASVK